MKPWLNIIWKLFLCPAGHHHWTYFPTPVDYVRVLYPYGGAWRRCIVCHRAEIWDYEKEWYVSPPN